LQQLPNLWLKESLELCLLHSIQKLSAVTGTIISSKYDIVTVLENVMTGTCTAY